MFLQVRYAWSNSFRSTSVRLNLRFAIPVLYDFYLICLSGTCVDLVISATGNAVYSNCGNGGEKQYYLNNSELLQLQKWIKQYQPVNYDHTDNALAGIVTTQLYLNGQGNQQASNVDTQHIIEFAIAMAAKVAMRP